jgi:hypothetical protein
MDSFDNVQSDELPFEPTAQDWAEYAEWEAGLEEELFFPDDYEPYYEGGSQFWAEDGPL